jgi:hypothetical protein
MEGAKTEEKVSRAELVERYEAKLKELEEVERTMDKLETLCMQKWKTGNLYLSAPPSRLEGRETRKIKVPAHCKLFSKSSCTSDVSLELAEPYQSFSLELIDDNNRRIARIGQNEIRRKIDPTSAEVDSK